MEPTEIKPVLEPVGLKSETQVVLERLGVTADKLAAFKAKHTEVRLLSFSLDEGRDVHCLVGSPTREHLSAFSADIMKSGSLKANNNLFFNCLLAPSADEMTALTRQYPGLVVGLANRLLEAAKITLEVADTRL